MDQDNMVFWSTWASIPSPCDVGLPLWEVVLMSIYNSFLKKLFLNHCKRRHNVILSGKKWRSKKPGIDGRSRLLTLAHVSLYSLFLICLFQTSLEVSVQKQLFENKSMVVTVQKKRGLWSRNVPDAGATWDSAYLKITSNLPCIALNVIGWFWSVTVAWSSGLLFVFSLVSGSGKWQASVDGGHVWRGPEIRKGWCGASSATVGVIRAACLHHPPFVKPLLWTLFKTGCLKVSVERCWKSKY